MVEIALTEDILFKKPDANPTISLLRNGELITRTAQRTADGSVTVYTVPEKKILFIIAMSLNAWSDDVGSNSTFIVALDNFASASRLLFLDIGFGHELGAFDGAVHNAISHSFAIPLRIEENRSIILDKSGGASTSHGQFAFQGYEIKKEIII